MSNIDNGKGLLDTPTPPGGSVHPTTGAIRRDASVPPRPPPRGDGSNQTLQHDDVPDQSCDVGYERIMDRFDKLDAKFTDADRRFDRLEKPLGFNSDNPPGLYNQTDWDYSGYQSHQRPSRPHNNRPFGNSQYDRDDGALMGRNQGVWESSDGDSYRDNRRRDGSFRQGANYRDTGGEYHAVASSWEPPPRRTHYDQQMGRGPSCWDPPQQQRQHFAPGNFEQQPRVKMEAPRFNGSDATNWTSRVQYYFDHLHIPDNQRLHYVVMLFDPPAAEWIFNYRTTNRFVAWRDFLEDVRHRFDPQSFLNYTGLIAKLVQTGTVADYHATFEQYLNRVTDLSEASLLQIFIAGLKPEIQEKVELRRPTSLAAAMATALQVAARNEDRVVTAAPQGRRPWPRDNRPPINQQPGPSPTLPGQGSSIPIVQQQRSNGPPRAQPIRVSNAEKAERARRGLCFYCPEKYTQSHVCQQKLLCYAEDGEEDDVVYPSGNDYGEDEQVVENSHIHSMNGSGRSRPLKVTGSIQDMDVSVLIDTGADRDFLHPRVAERLRLPLFPIKPFRIFVGNGASLLCTHVSKQTELVVQGTVFRVDLHILEIHGPDVILGMDWLESLGKVTADFVGKTLEFVQNDKRVFLQGILPPPRRLSPHSLSLLTQYHPGDLLYELIAVEPESTSLPATDPDAFPPDLPSQILKALEAHRLVFAVPTGMPPIRHFDHRIHLLPNSKPVNVRPYRYPYFQKNEIERQVREMLDQGIIQRSQSSFSSPVLLIRKKDETFRFCIDYRALNAATVPDHFPIPTADELFDELGRARFFTKLDLRSGYHQIRMNADDVFKTAFRTHDGHYEFLVMPFGLTNAPSTFQAAMNSIFRPILRKFVIVFFDDILVYSSSLDLHAQHLTEVLSLLQTHQFYVKLSKCSFCSTTVEYLGHLISDGLLKADPAKIEAMTAWPTPKNVKQLRGFLGLTGYYRRFIAHYAMIAAPLTDLLKKDAFSWASTAEDSFVALKSAMTSAPVLKLPDFDVPFCLETDASDVGIGAVLLQHGHPIAFFSKKLGPRRRTASTYHKELYAIVEAVQKWRQYLLGREFVIRSDQKSLKELLSKWCRHRINNFM